MKKVISFTMMLALLVSLFCCGAAVLAEAESLEGVWYLNSVEIEGVEMSPASLGLEMVMTLETDDTVLIQVTGEEDESGAWSRDGDEVTVTIEGETMVFVLQGDALVVEDDGATMIFGREKSEMEEFVAAPIREDVALSDFDGMWTATILDMAGMQLPVAALGMDMTLTIENGRAVLVSLEWEEEQTNEVDGIFEDNSLTLDIPSTETTGGMTMALVLHEDGMMSFGDEEATIYFERS